MEILAPKLLILASAGSGKTYQLSNRIIGRVAMGAEPEQVVALTFTRKAAAEFADTMLSKLAQAATDPQAAARLEQELGIEAVDFGAVLGKVAKSLHRITLGTMDSFFSKVVRGFQVELGLTGGSFELIEGAQSEILTDEILQSILGEVFDSGHGDAFSHAFRRATIGREQQGITRSLREFIRIWHRLLRQQPGAEWGPSHLTGHQVKDWDEQRFALADMARRDIDRIAFTRKGQREKLLESIDALCGHGIGSGSLSEVSSLTESIIVAAGAPGDGPLLVKSHKEFLIDGSNADALRQMVRLIAHCEVAAAVERTRAIREVIEAYDAQCERRLRRQGRLGFDDVKWLMGAWAGSEEARLRREWIDFRLDARYRHWLLDEFQDTSRADWNGLFPLLDEAATSDEHSLFIVGDRKQAIYAWRGGEVGLFDEVIRRYRGTGDDDLKIEPLDESWRSCPEVLDLVNRICTDQAAVRALFGAAGDAWECHPHVPAAPLRRPEKAGHAQVEIVGNWEARLARLTALLGELGVGKRQLTCGVLLRGNEKAKEVANHLRNQGFDVILEGHREPGKDTPLGVAVTHLLKWLADPGNRHARLTVAMSPLGAALCRSHGDDWRRIWSEVTAAIACDGYHDSIAALLDDCGIEWSEFGRRRADDLLRALAGFDRQGGVITSRAATLLERLQISQSPGAAAVQVMTIHKSKGLGFDVVILPDIPSGKIPDAGHYEVTGGDGWLCQTPPQWVRQLVPDIAKHEAQWGQEQQYEALCTLYVALTRAKRGLHVLLNEPGDNHDGDKASLENWVLRTCTGTGDALASTGVAGWSLALPELPALQSSAEHRELPPATSATTRVAPSRHPNGTRMNPEGMRFGNQVHALLEAVGWIDDAMPNLPDDDAGRAARSLLDGNRRFFERGGRAIRLLREQPIDASLNGQWISGVIDRLHLHLDDQGQVVAVDIVDFKTDRVDTLEELAVRHRAQLHAYRDCLQRMHPQADIRCHLLSTHLSAAVAV